MDRSALEDRWHALVRDEMPAAASQRGWPVRFDHCFARNLLDAACGTVWYESIPRRPAYRHAPDDVLARAVRLGEAALRGEADLHALNESSLAARGKRGPAAARSRRNEDVKAAPGTPDERRG